MSIQFLAYSCYIFLRIFFTTFLKKLNLCYNFVVTNIFGTWLTLIRYSISNPIEFGYINILKLYEQAMKQEKLLSQQPEDSNNMVADFEKKRKPKMQEKDGKSNKNFKFQSALSIFLFLSSKCCEIAQPSSNMNCCIHSSTVYDFFI